MSIEQAIDPKIEAVLQEVIFPDLLKGRKDFDLPHTKAVVHWMKRLLSEIDDPDLDSQVLVTAAYAHDWGYIGLFEGVNSSDPKEIAKRKPLHMERGAELITNLITKKLPAFFSKEQIQAVAHLVSVHDKVEQLTTEAEKLLMEADTLGMLDTDLVKPTFSKEDNERFMKNEIYNRRMKNFKHQTALKLLDKMVQSRENFYRNSGPNPNLS